MPRLVEASALRAGHCPLVFAIAGEADSAGFASTVHAVRWGEIGRLFRLLREAGSREAVFVGSITRRPDFAAIRPDLGAVGLLPRILKLMRSGDDSLLNGVAAILAEKGVALRGPLEIAPDLALPPGLLTGPQPDRDADADIAAAVQAARFAGSLDIGQAAIAIAGRVVAVEGAEGTDGLMQRVGPLRQAGRLPPHGGVLVKCMKPQQDPRIDVPTLGARTAELARAAGLDGVAAEAGRTLLAGREETIAAFGRAGLFLVGLPGPG